MGTFGRFFEKRFLFAEHIISTETRGLCLKCGVRSIILVSIVLQEQEKMGENGGKGTEELDSQRHRDLREIAWKFSKKNVALTEGRKWLLLLV